MFRLSSIFLFVWITALTCSSENGQEKAIQIKGQIVNLHGVPVFLAAIKGESQKIIDTVRTLHDGSFCFNLDQTQNGQYRIIPQIALNSGSQSHGANLIDLIVDKESITLRTVFPWIPDSLAFINSRENQLYLTFLRKNIALQKQIDILDRMLDNLPGTDNRHPELVQQFSSLQRERHELVHQLISVIPGSFAAELCSMQLIPILDGNLPKQQRLEYLKTHFFDLIDFDDERLIHSDAYTSTSFQYLMLHRNIGLSGTEQEREYQRAVDSILYQARNNDVVFDFLLNYLMNGFEQLRMDHLLEYLASNYNSKTCVAEQKTTLQRRLEAHRNQVTGYTCPDFNVPGPDGQPIRLSDMNNNVFLVVFWASWCPHCMESLPALKQWYDQQDMNLEIIAISLDTVRSDWLKAVSDHAFLWKNGCDLLGWEGKTAKDYNVYATPTLFLLDRQRKILAKPTDIESFIRIVDTL